MNIFHVHIVAVFDKAVITAILVEILPEVLSEVILGAAVCMA